MKVVSRICSILLFATAVFFLATEAYAALTLLNGVPDWNQPYDYAPPGPDPNAALPNNPYDNYCTPAAASNLFGYWEDVKGFPGLADGQVAGATPAWPAAAGWNQDLWHDGVIELGWHLDTNDVNPNIAPNAGHLGTLLGQIANGLASYGNGAWVDVNNTKVAYVTNAWSVGWGGLGGSTPWDDYGADININRPVLINFDYWNPVNPQVDANYPSIDKFYDWGPNPGASLGHTVTGVGWLDKDGNNNTDADKYWIVHDNWPNALTPKTIAIPYKWAGSSAFNWQQNDHVNVVPEPATMILFGLGLVGLVGLRKKR